jgi:hypothetical protein
MAIKRRRFKQTQSLEDRLIDDTTQLEEQTKMLPPGPTRDAVVRRIWQKQAAVRICEMLRSSGSR